MSKYESRIKALEEAQEMMTTSKKPITTFPCCDCLDGDRFEPAEGGED